MANLLLSVMGAFAEFERALILERQREGITAAKTRGVYTGRKPSLDAAQAAELRRRAAAGESKAALAREYRISRETVYAYLRPGNTPAADPQPAASAATSPAQVRRHSAQPLEGGRVVDLSAELGDPAGTWHLVETEPGSWQVRHDGARVGVVRRESTTRGRRGWLARLDTGVPVAAPAALATATGSTLWRTRDLAAAAIARLAAPQGAHRRR